MKICLINTYKGGGAGIACRRLQAALNKHGAAAQLLTREEAGKKWPFYAERLSFLPYEKDKSVRFAFSLANFGSDISKHPAVQEADIIHLHWVNQGFLSLQNIRTLGQMGKPIVWTLHDMWAFTGGCHYSRGCDHFQQTCGDCDYLRRPGPLDLSHHILGRKARLLPQNIQYVTCSRWLGEVAQSSTLLQDAAVLSIPNPIDTEAFKPLEGPTRRQVREALGIRPGKAALLFVAMKISETRKGFAFLQKALHALKTRHPELDLDILALGKAEAGMAEVLPYPTRLLGLLTDAQAIANAYAAADLFVIPSLEDNLPNTVMESLACGTPVAGFNTGGIPEMVEDGVQGLIAPQGDAWALEKAIFGILTQEDPEKMRQAARLKVETHYSEAVIAGRYMDLYRSLL